VADIRNALGLRGLTEYLELWGLISEVNLTDADDLDRWKPEASGVFSTKSAYRCYFVGSVTFEPCKRIRKAWAPGKCKTFLWLAIRNCCWTAHRLQKRGMPHPEHYPLCDQEDETAQHILTTCVFARQFWYAILQPLSLESLTPTRRVNFADWWRKAEKRIQKQHKKGFNSLCILGAWTLQKHRNACVFDGSSPNLQVAVQAFKDEAHLCLCWGEGAYYPLPSVGRNLSLGFLGLVVWSCGL